MLAGMNVNVWDVTEPDPGADPARGTAVDTEALADPHVPLGELAGRD